MKQFDELPVWMQELMLERQVEQGNPRNPEVFMKNIWENHKGGGFDWSHTKEGSGVWFSTVYNSDYSLLLKANRQVNTEKKEYYYTVSYDRNKRFVLKKNKRLTSKELNLIRSVLDAAGHTEIQIEQGVPPTPAIEEVTK